MNGLSKKLITIAAVGACSASTAVFADNPAGFYLGAGIGESNLRSDGYGYNDYYGYDDHHTAWKLVAGVRPISPVGAELEYIDFGSGGRGTNYSYGNYYFNGYDGDAKAAALFGVGYLPLPLPFLDVFGKAGIARLEASNTNYYGGSCNQPALCTVNAAFRNDAYSTNFAYGVGVQTKFLGLAVRAEYERISASGGDPDALTIGATWTF